MVGLQFDDTLIPATSKLPANPAEALLDLLQCEPPDDERPRPAPPPGTRLPVVHRDFNRVVEPFLRNEIRDIINEVRTSAAGTLGRIPPELA